MKTDNSTPDKSTKLATELALILRTFRLDSERVIRLSTGEEVVGTVLADGYVQVRVGSMKDGTRRLLRMHRIKWALAYGWMPEFIDHIDGDRSNNDLANLRPCTRSDNAANSSYAGMRPPKSGKRNVVEQPNGKFGARVWQGGNFHWLGTFSTREEAKAAVEAFKREHRGEFYVPYAKRENTAKLTSKKVRTAKTASAKAKTTKAKAMRRKDMSLPSASERQSLQQNTRQEDEPEA